MTGFTTAIEEIEAAIVPAWVRIAILLVVVGAVVLALKGCHDNLIARGQAIERGVQAERDRAQLRANENESMRRLAAQEKADHDAQILRDQAAVARRRERAAAGQLRDTLAAVDVERRRADPAASKQCAAAEATVDLRTDLFGRADDAAGELAAFAQASRIAGIECERRYDALRTAQ